MNIISEPSTGGDPGVLYCVAWTGSGSGTDRDGVLLMNAPGYQCGANLVNSAGTVDVLGDETVVFYETEQDCTPLYPETHLTYPAVLDYSSLGDQETPQYVCLTEQTGACPSDLYQQAIDVIAFKYRTGTPGPSRRHGEQFRWLSHEANPMRPSPRSPSNRKPRRGSTSSRGISAGSGSS
ncbi:hypothetical protein ABT272_31080 [Streptomyces sp900105245]|uniref:Uncharacterized protein n=1 Tax=Streptomyces sp. 900105245 TaxID=3154379 RepID=A0ABV1UEL3_9ACTN